MVEKPTRERQYWLPYTHARRHKQNGDPRRGGAPQAAVLGCCTVPRYGSSGCRSNASTWISEHQIRPHLSIAYSAAIGLALRVISNPRVEAAETRGSINRSAIKSPPAAVG